MKSMGLGIRRDRLSDGIGIELLDSNDTVRQSHKFRSPSPSSATRLLERVCDQLKVRHVCFGLRREDRLVGAVFFELRLESLRPRMLSARLDTEMYGAQTYVDRFLQLLRIFGNIALDFRREAGVAGEIDQFGRQDAERV